MTPDVASLFRIISTIYRHSLHYIQAAVADAVANALIRLFKYYGELYDFLACHLMANTNGSLNKRYIKSLYLKLFQRFTFYYIQW